MDANASGALLVTRHGCAPAMPTKLELDNFLQRHPLLQRPDRDAYLNHLHRATTRKQQWPELCVFAFDHRKQLVEMAHQAGASTERIPHLKNLLLAAVQAAATDAGLQGNCGILADSTYGQAALNSITGQGWWVGRPVELPGSRPLRLEHGNIGSQLIDWPQEQVVKCLVFYHPNDAEPLRQEQDELILEVYQGCCKSGHELLLEVILPEQSTDQDPRYYLQIIEHFYQLGVRPSWWKVPPLSAALWQQVGELIETHDPFCRGILILGLDAAPEKLKAGFAAAADAHWVKGFAVGRTIFGSASHLWLQDKLNDTQLIEQVKQNYLTLLGFWQLARPHLDNHKRKQG